MKKHEFYVPVRSIFGEGTLSEMGSEISGERVFVVIDKFLYESNLKGKIDTILARKEVRYFTEFLANPDVISINNGLDSIRQFAATTIVGIGGGSTLDIAKFLSAAINEEGNTESIIEKGFVVGSKIRSISIPTTSGTGSEVTNVSVISNYEKKTKAPLVNNALYADLAILDPLLTVSLPKVVTANSGIDTFCHAIEAYWNINSTPISDVLAIEAMKLVNESLLACYNNGDDIESRTKMLQASLDAGLAFTQTRTTILHAVSFPLTTKFNIPHGLACSILLPSFIRYFGRSNPKMSKLILELGFEDVEALAKSVEDLMDNMEMERKLEQHGIAEEDLDLIATEAMKEKIAKLGPKLVDEEIIVNLLKGVMYV